MEVQILGPLLVVADGRRPVGGTKVRGTMALLARRVGTVVSCQELVDELWGDRLPGNTAVIFGDGAGAVVLRAGTAAEPGAAGPFDLGSDGDGSDLIAIPGGGSRQRLSGRPESADDRYFTMAGKEVFRHAVLRMTESARSVLHRAGRPVGDIDRVGNTAAASIPLALAHGVADGVVRPGHRILLTAFGGGLT